MFKFFTDDETVTVNGRYALTKPAKNRNDGRVGGLEITEIVDPGTPDSIPVMPGSKIGDFIGGYLPYDQAADVEIF